MKLKKYIIILLTIFNCNIYGTSTQSTSATKRNKNEQEIYILKDRDKILKYNELVSLPIETIKLSGKGILNFLNAPISEYKEFDFDGKALKLKIKKKLFSTIPKNKKFSLLEFFEIYLPQIIDNVFEKNKNIEISKKKYFKVLKKYFETQALEVSKTILDRKLKQRKNFNYPKFWELFDSIPKAVELEDKVRKLKGDFKIELLDNKCLPFGQTDRGLNAIFLKNPLSNIPLIVSTYIHELTHLSNLYKAHKFVKKEKSKFMIFSSRVNDSYKIQEIHEMENDEDRIFAKLSKLMYGFHLNKIDLKEILHKSIDHQIKDNFIQKVFKYPLLFNRLLLLEKFVSTGDELEAHLYQYFATKWKTTDGKDYIDVNALKKINGPCGKKVKFNMALSFNKKLNKIFKDINGNWIYKPIYKANPVDPLPGGMNILYFKDKAGKIYKREEIINQKLFKEIFSKYLVHYMCIPEYIGTNLKRMISRGTFMFEFFRTACLEFIELKKLQQLEKKIGILCIELSDLDSKKKVSYNEDKKTITLNNKSLLLYKDKYTDFYRDLAKEYLQLLKSLN